LGPADVLTLDPVSTFSSTPVTATSSGTTRSGELPGERPPMTRSGAASVALRATIGQFVILPV
jgi:hypothetical protein